MARFAMRDAKLAVQLCHLPLCSARISCLRTTLLLIFSGQPLSGLWTGLQQWLESVGEEFTSLPKTQVFKLHCEEGWFNRRTHQLTKFQLRRQARWRSRPGRPLGGLGRPSPVVVPWD
eukprot:g22313.t1